MEFYSLSAAVMISAIGLPPALTKSPLFSRNPLMHSQSHHFLTTIFLKASSTPTLTRCQKGSIPDVFLEFI